MEINREVGDRHNEAISLYNKALALAKYEPRRFEALDTLQQARTIYTKLKLDHRVEQYNKAIYDFNRIIPTERQSAPDLAVAPPISKALSKDDWYARSLPTQKSQTRQTPAASNPDNRKFILWFCVGIAIVLLIAWLKR